MTTDDAAGGVASDRTSDGRRRLIGPIVCGCAGAAVVVALAVGDRTDSGIPCPIRATTGLWCPGCGLTRAMRALLDGDLGAALGHNLMVPVVLVGLVAGWWAWLRHARERAPMRWQRRLATAPPGIWWTLGLAVVIFTVARNLPVGAPLAP